MSRGASGRSATGHRDAQAAATRLASLIREAGSVVALTGAGVSVPSGIPDFRSPQTGLWSKVNPMEVAHIDVFRRDPAHFWSFYGQRFDTLDQKQPNRAHRILAELEHAGLLDAVITQNIDRLHERAGSREVVEVHGSIATSSCLRCGARFELAEVRLRQRGAPDGVPPCDCGAPLKPDVVLFGELLPVAAIARAELLAGEAGLLLCVGSSLEVYPVAGLPDLTLAAGGRVAIITQGSTPFDGVASVRMAGDVVEDLEGLHAALGRPEEARGARGGPGARAAAGRAPEEAARQGGFPTVCLIGLLRADASGNSPSRRRTCFARSAARRTSGNRRFVLIVTEELAQRAAKRMELRNLLVMCGFEAPSGLALNAVLAKCRDVDLAFTALTMIPRPRWVEDLIVGRC